MLKLPGEYFFTKIQQVVLFAVLFGFFVTAHAVTHYQVALDDGSYVTVDSISTQYSQNEIETMVYTADRSTRTGCPYSSPFPNPQVKGLINSGDRVFISDNYIAWFDYTVTDGYASPSGWPASTYSRAGALTGLWSLSPSVNGPNGVHFQNVVGIANSTYNICPNWARNELIPGSYSPSGLMNWWDKYAPPNENEIAVAYSNDSSQIHEMDVNLAQENSAAAFTILQEGVQQSNGVVYETSEYLVDKFGNVITFAGTTGATGTIQSNLSYVASQTGIDVYWNFSPSVDAEVSNLYSTLTLSYAYMQDETVVNNTVEPIDLSTTCENQTTQSIIDTLPTPVTSTGTLVYNPFPYDFPSGTGFASQFQNAYQTANSNLNIYSGKSICSVSGYFYCPAGASSTFNVTSILTLAGALPCYGPNNVDMDAYDYVGSPSGYPTVAPLGFDTNRLVQINDWYSVQQANAAPLWVLTNLRAPFTGTANQGIGFPFDRITLSYDHGDLTTSVTMTRGPYKDADDFFTLQAGTWYSVAYSITRPPVTTSVPAASPPNPSTAPITTANITRNCNVASYANAYPPTVPYQLAYIYCLMLKRLPDGSGIKTYTPEMQLGTLTWQQMMDVTFNSTEFANDFSITTLSNTQFVTDLYNILLSRAPDSTGLNSYVNDLSSGNFTRQQVFDAFISGAEFLNDSPVLSRTH